MTEKTDRTSELLQAILAATDERKEQALRVLRGEVPEKVMRPMTGPLLLGMGAACRLLGVSRATLWRILQAGTIQKVELFPGSFRVRREDVEALAAGEFGFSPKVSKRGRPKKDVRANDLRFQQLKALADEGDENAAADLFKEFQFDHGAGRFVDGIDGTQGTDAGGAK
jgi:excisionase family DNA binding protein